MKPVPGDAVPGICRCATCGDLFMSRSYLSPQCQYCRVLRDIDLTLDKLEQEGVRLAG